MMTESCISAENDDQNFAILAEIGYLAGHSRLGEFEKPHPPRSTDGNASITCRANHSAVGFALEPQRS